MKQPTLAQTLASQQTEVTGYAIQPTTVATPRPIYDAFMVLIGARAPVVDTTIHQTAQPTYNQSQAPGMPLGVPGNNFDSGAPAIRANAAGVYGGIH